MSDGLDSGTLRGMPTGEIREDTILDGKLILHIDDPDGDHPLDKKAWIWGYPQKVKP